mgnify:CR=1 FL=1
MTYEEMTALVAAVLPGKRFVHSIRVAETAVLLAQCHQVDVVKARTAGILHDFCKAMPKEEQIALAVSHHLLTSEEDLRMPQVLHGPVASVVLKEKQIVEENDILLAIRYHTTGCAHMDNLAKIIFIADYVEPGRITPNITCFFEIAKTDLDGAMIAIIDQTMRYLTENNKMIHIDMVRCRNRLLADARHID